MTLENLIDNLNEIDEDLVIFQKDQLSINSEVVLFDRKNDDIIRIKDNVKYVYFLEVEIAKEFINDWVASLPVKPNSKTIALRVLEYAIHDA
ncbi:MAG: hypothetical protein ABIN91_16235 [Mucilaginibacter sp.]|uniref:hypothetical protein n=1 Tax=Mucilaginibacter sp. TaxID=1882438 RepID=UPI0032671AB3